jgi:membrane-associated phospholipid phosphatase
VAQRYRFTIWICATSVLAVSIAWCYLDGIWLDPARLAGVIAIYIVLAALAELFYRIRRLRVLGMCIDTLDQLWTTAAGFTLIQYPAARHGGALVDPALARIDHALGFDWSAHFAAVQTHPYLMDWAGHAYTSYAILTPILVLLVGVYNFRRLQECLLANIVGASFCAFVSVLFPAVGAAGFFLPESEWPFYVHQFLLARAGEISFLRYDDLAGIEQFPSYHATMAVLYIFAFMGLPRWVAAPFVLLECAMMYSAIPIGGHHLADVIAGLTIGIAAISIVKFATRGSSTAKHAAEPLVAAPAPSAAASSSP